MTTYKIQIRLKGDDWKDAVENINTWSEAYDTMEELKVLGINARLRTTERL